MRQWTVINQLLVTKNMKAVRCFTIRTDV